MNQNIQALNTYEPAFFELDIGDVDSVSGAALPAAFVIGAAYTAGAVTGVGLVIGAVALAAWALS